MDKAKLNNNNLKLAIQKDGRLTEETLDFLRKAGLEFESYKQRLFSLCRNFPLEILYVRDDDIPDYVESGTVDIGIVGQNILSEERPDVKKLLNLRFAFCSFGIAVPKESEIMTIKDLQYKTIATTYPNSLKKFLRENKIKAEIIKIRGSVEIAPALGVASAIADLISSGSTLALNDLRILTNIYDSEAVLIANSKTMNDEKRKALVKKLMMRFKSVLSAKSYKFIMMNAPREALPKLIKLVPGLKSPTISDLADPNWVCVQTIIKEEVLWQTVEKLKASGVESIMVLPVEKMIL